MTHPRHPQNRKDPVVPRRPRLAIASLALAGGLVLSGCGSSEVTEVGQAEPRTAAATIGDRTITVGDVQEATAGTNAFIREQGGQQQLDARDILTTLIYAPEITAAAREAGISVPSAAAVERVLGQIGIERAPATVEFIRAQSVREQMTPQQVRSAVEAATDDVTLNPRYGTFDPQQGIVDAQPNWLAEKSASEAGLEEGHTPDDGHDH